MGKGGAQTLYLGTRPNFFRIYDKIGEYLAQYAKILRGFDPTVTPPTFEELFGVSSGMILTRVERQFGGKIPERLATVGHLKNATEFRPFDALRIVAGSKALPRFDEYPFMDLCTGLYLKQLVESQGMHEAIRFINRYSNRNTNKYLDKFREFIADECPELEKSDFLNDAYRKSVSRQITV